MKIRYTQIFLVWVLTTPMVCYGQEAKSNSKTEVKQPASTVAEGPSDDIAAKMKELLISLDGDTLVERDQAAKDILAIGPAALPFLEKLGADISGEMQARVQAITEQLKTKDIQEYIKPTLVTLQGSFTVKEALDRVTEQTENRFRMLPNSDKKIELDLVDVSFWEAVDEILDAAGMDVENFASTANGLPLKERAETTSLRILRAAYTDAFRIEPIEVVSKRSLLNPSQSSLTVKAWVAWEPRMTPIFLQFPMKNFELTLPDGTKLSATTPEEAPEYSPEPNSFQTEIEFTTKLPSRDVVKIEGIKSSFVAALPGKMAKLTFDKLDKPGKKSSQSGNLMVTVDRVRKNNNAYEVSVSIKLDKANQTMESFRGWISGNEAYLLDEDDRRIENVGKHSTRLGRSEVGFLYLFDMSKGPEKYRFVYEAPGAVNEQSFEFELSEIELP